MKNKTLIILSCFLTLLVILSAITHTKNNRFEYIATDNELFIMNIHCIPEVVRSYDNVKHIYGKKNILFFRYLNTSCGSCTDSYLNEILVFQEEIGKDKIWIFPAYPNNRTARIQLRVDLGKFNYKNIPRDSLIIPVYEGEEKSYFALTNEDGEIGMVFFPDKDNVQHTRKYLLEVKKLLQASDNNK